jgi:hypothetical protein
MINLKTAKALGMTIPPGIAVARRRNNRIERDFRCWHEAANPGCPQFGR